MLFYTHYVKGCSYQIGENAEEHKPFMLLVGM